MPALRIHFAAEDLTRTRLAANADLHCETALSLDLLTSTGTTGAAGPLGRWRTWARKRLGTWALPLLAADPAARADLPDGPALRRRYQAEVIEPVWAQVSLAVLADRSRRTRRLLEEGLEGLLDDLGPTSRWRAPALEVDHPRERDVHLDGRGVTLVPSWFCSRDPVLVTGAAGPALLVHPIAPGTRIPLLPPQERREHRPRQLEALFGPTRAAVLLALTDTGTTTELAQRVGISPASASRHAGILRAAGLISTQRRGPSVLHAVTALGSAVLERR